MCTATNAVALLEFGQQAHVRQTKGRPGLAGVHRSHLATDIINDIDWLDSDLQMLHNAKKQNKTKIKW